MIATGSSPLKPQIPGIDHKNIFTLWNVNDMDNIKSYINENKISSAAVIGGGFIGLEMAENLNHANLEVTLIEMQNQVMAPLDLEMANLLHENIIANGVDLILNDGVKAFEDAGEKIKIILTSGQEVIVDMVVLSIGVKPNSELAAKANLALNAKKE
ncbi:NAD(P)/FAD-dependent oxidoreductase [Coprobacillaceae bacterium CR2/5/TPMF4]|nr:NAD(P)/FAD-dependent oxidoreductase [Coprobacillaceae bacterium CR2/5/TPMF4]